MISEIIEEWIKGILIDGITGNLSGLFDNVNAKVGEIAAEYFSQNKNLQNAANALPIYIRNKVAETTAEREKNKTQK